MTDKLMYIPKDDTQNYSSVDHNQWLKRIYTQLNEPHNQNPIKVPDVVKPSNKKMLS